MQCQLSVVFHARFAGRELKSCPTTGGVGRAMRPLFPSRADALGCLRTVALTNVLQVVQISKTDPGNLVESKVIARETSERGTCR